MAGVSGDRLRWGKIMDDSQLVQRALEARKQAYAPYSGFAVGAALLTEKGRVYVGANVENASLGLSICAERVAVFSAVAAGEREFVRLAVAANAQEPAIPCGACLQVIRQFSDNLGMICANPEGEVRLINIRDLLPDPFLFDSWDKVSRDGSQHKRDSRDDRSHPAQT